MTLAVGGTRIVAEPDPIAREYIRLALLLDQHIPGLVDGYFGPAELKAEADLGQGRSPAGLRDDLGALRMRLSGSGLDADRRLWLDAQLIALETQAAAAAGNPLPYLDHVERCFGYRPVRRGDAGFAAAADRIAGLLPGDGPIADRLADWDSRFVIPVDRLPTVIDWLVGRFRERAARLFGLPDGEDLRVSLVTDQPWSGYNWFHGGRRSRVDINTDLPVRAADLLHTVAHETYPGHHLEHVWKETELVDRRGHLEASILLINTPECLISEGLADLGVRFAVPDDDRVHALLELYERAGLDIVSDREAARAAAECSVALAEPREVIGAIRGDAAIRRHAEGWSHADALAYLIEVGRFSPAVATKRLEFIEHPLWRTYVFVYADGEAMLSRWLDAVPPDTHAARFARLLKEPLTTATILAETGVAGTIEAGQSSPA